MRVLLDSSPTLDHIAIQLHADELNALEPKPCSDKGLGAYLARTYICADAEDRNDFFVRASYLPSGLEGYVSMHELLKPIFRAHGAILYQHADQADAVYELVFDERIMNALTTVGKHIISLGMLELRFENASYKSETSEFQIQRAA